MAKKHKRPKLNNIQKIKDRLKEVEYNIGDLIVTELNEVAIIQMIYPDGSCKVHGDLKGNIKQIIKHNGKE